MNDTLSWISDPGACKQKLKPNNYSAQENMKLFIFINTLFEREVKGLGLLHIRNKYENKIIQREINKKLTMQC